MNAITPGYPLYKYTNYDITIREKTAGKSVVATAISRCCNNVVLRVYLPFCHVSPLVGTRTPARCRLAPGATTYTGMYRHNSST